jgi:hypothetical protein
MQLPQRTKKVRFDVDYGGTYTESNGKAELVYNRLVQYIGEINGVSNVQEANRSYTEVMRTYLTIQDKHLTFYLEL